MARRTLSLILIVTALAMLLAACANSEQTGQTSYSGDTIMDVLAADGRFTTLVEALEASNVADTLRQPYQYTLFAPTDAAFAALPDGTLEAWLDNPLVLARIMNYHIIADSFTSEEFVQMGVVEIESLQDDMLTMNVRVSPMQVNGVNVSGPDIEASNGVIHAIDGVLIPPAVE